MTMKKITEHDIRVVLPENLTVGQLNQVVRALREELRQKQFTIQELEGTIKNLRMFAKFEE